MASLNPYVKADKFKPFDGGTELVPGIQAVQPMGTRLATRFTPSKARARNWCCGVT